MAQARKFHAPGVGGRTGMKVGEDVRSLSGFFNAGQQHMNQSYDDDSDGEDDDEDDDVDEEEEEEGEGEEETRDDSAILSPVRNQGRKSSAMGRKSSNAQGSSSMDLENSYAPSPNRSRRTAAGNDDSFPLDNSLVDLGDDQQDYSDDGAGPSAGRQSLSVVSPIGRGRNRPSGAGSLRDQSASRRQSGRSSFDVNNDSLDRSADMPMMDDEIPSFNVDANDEEAAEAALGSGDEVEDGVQVDHNAGAAGLDGTGAGKAERESARRGKKGEKGAMRVERTERAGSGPLSAKDREIKEKVPRSRGGSVIEGDVRRSTRHRYTPLEYWRGERAIYGRASVRLGGSRHRVRDSAEQDGADETAGDDTIEADAFEDAPIKSYAVPVLREVIRIRRDVDEGTFSGLKIKRKGINGSRGRPVKRTVKRKRSRKADGESDDEDDGEVDPTQPTRHPEEGWDEATDPHGMVWDVERQSEVERRIACPISQVRPKTAINSDFAFEKVFGVDDYMAAGILEIPVGGGKPSKPTKDNNYTFVVLEGAVDVQVHRTKFTIAPGGMFMVPKGNVYSIHNRCQRPCRIFFAQARQAQPRKDIGAIKNAVIQGAVLGAARAGAGAGAEEERPALQRVDENEPGKTSRATSRANGSASPAKRGRGGGGGVGSRGGRGGATAKRGRK